VEDTCDKVAFIKGGRIISTVATDDIKHSKDKTYKIEFAALHEYQRFIAEDLDFSETREDQNQVVVGVHDANINEFTSLLRTYDLAFITEVKYSLEKYFKSLY